MKTKTGVKEQQNNEKGAKGEMIMPLVIQKVRFPW